MRNENWSKDSVKDFMQEDDLTLRINSLPEGQTIDSMKRAIIIIASNPIFQSYKIQEESKPLDFVCSRESNIDNSDDDDNYTLGSLRDRSGGFP